MDRFADRGHPPVNTTNLHYSALDGLASIHTICEQNHAFTAHGRPGQRPTGAGGEGRQIEPTPAIGQPLARHQAETTRLYAAEWRAFAAWCRTAKRTALPTDAETLAAYLRDAATTTCRGTLGRKRAAIRAMHRQHNFPVPALDLAARRDLRHATRAATSAARPGGARAAGRQRVAQVQAAWAQMARHCPQNLAGLRDRALLLLAATGSARQDELLGLDCEQLRIVASGAELRLARGAKSTIVLVERDTTDCPVKALEIWLDVSATRFGPVFRKVDRWGNVEHARLGPDGLRRIVARRSPAPGNGAS